MKLKPRQVPNLAPVAGMTPVVSLVRSNSPLATYNRLSVGDYFLATTEFGFVKKGMLGRVRRFRMFKSDFTNKMVMSVDVQWQTRAAALWSVGPLSADLVLLLEKATYLGSCGELSLQRCSMLNHHHVPGDIVLIEREEWWRLNPALRATHVECKVMGTMEGMILVQATGALGVKPITVPSLRVHDSGQNRVDAPPSQDR